MTETCPTCGGEYKGLNQHRSLSHDWSPYEISECNQCGDEFEYRPSNGSNGNFCSRQCSAKSKEKQVDCTCDECGEAFQIPEAWVRKGQGKFCSRECRGSHYSGENSPMWKGGETEGRYINGWRTVAKECRERADYECEHPDCSRNECQSGRKLHVHHIIPARNFDDQKEAMEKDNLLVLCKEHHEEIEPVRGMKV